MGHDREKATHTHPVLMVTGPEFVAALEVWSVNDVAPFTDAAPPVDSSAIFPVLETVTV